MIRKFMQIPLTLSDEFVQADLEVRASGMKETRIVEQEAVLALPLRIHTLPLSVKLPDGE